LLIPEILPLIFLLGLAVLVGTGLIFSLLYAFWWPRRKKKKPQPTLYTVIVRPHI
jgi:hypothetical protein